MPHRDETDLDVDLTAFPRIQQGSINIDSDNELTVQTDNNSRILMAQRQWDLWNQEFTRVTFNSNTSGTSGVWRFENPSTYTTNQISSSTSTNSIYLNPDTFATNCIEIRGDLRIVPDDSVEWNPGVVLPYEAHSIPASQFQPGVRGPRLTAEQRRRRNEANTAWLRAEQLLRRYLNRDQRRELTQDGMFHIEVGERRYRIKRGRVGNIEWVDRDGHVLQRYCCHVRDVIPTGDNLLAQMMMLIHNEPEFIRLANVHYRRDGIAHPLENRASGPGGRIMLGQGLIHAAA